MDCRSHHFTKHPLIATTFYVSSALPQIIITPTHLFLVAPLALLAPKMSLIVACTERVKHAPVIHHPTEVKFTLFFRGIQRRSFSLSMFILVLHPSSICLPLSPLQLFFLQLPFLKFARLSNTTSLVFHLLFDCTTIPTPCCHCNLIRHFAQFALDHLLRLYSSSMCSVGQGKVSLCIVSHHTLSPILLIISNRVSDFATSLTQPHELYIR